jgi:nucleoside phosphorylase
MILRRIKVAAPIDIAVYVALNEEFNHVLKTVPASPTIEEDPDISATYFIFELDDSLATKKTKVLLVSAGVMGPPRAAALTAHINSRFRPQNFVVLGISGSLDKGLLLGDVFIPKIVDNYLSVAAATPGEGSGKWSLSTSSGPYRPDSRLLDRVRSFRHIYPSPWQDWKQETDVLADQLLGDKRSAAIHDNITRDHAALLAEEANLASGELLGRSDAFVEWIKSQDRKYAAMDMESSGVLDVSDLAGKTGPRFIAIRGISDFADERKTQVEADFRGVFRQIAIENAASFLWIAIQYNLFSSDIVGATAIDTSLYTTDDFHHYLLSTDILFQHRHKETVTLPDLFIYPDIIPIRAEDSTTSSKINSSTLSDLKMDLSGSGRNAK